MERDQPGFLNMFMGLVAAGGDPDDYRAEVDGDQIRFVRHVEKKTKNGSSSSTTTVTMIRDGGQWRFGKARS